VVPLASFAADQTTKGQDVCYIYVEMLDESLADSKQIVLGQMFFQSFVMFNTVSGASFLSTSVQIGVNVNALNGTYITDGSGITQMTTSPFAINMATVRLDDASSLRGLPTVEATMSGFINFKAPFFFLDFNSSSTQVWTADCMQSLNGTAVSCAEMPTDVIVDYNNVTKGEPFSNATFGGYLTDGFIYVDAVCTNFGNICKDMEVYGCDTIKDDIWLYDIKPEYTSYGSIGYAPSSNLWNEYVDPDTLTATYSLDLNSDRESTFTLGGYETNLTDYPSLVISRGCDDAFGYDEFGFGKVYYDTDGNANSSYFANFTTGAGITFQTNFEGIGLPPTQFADFSAMLKNVTSSSTACDSQVGGTCTIPGACADLTSLEDYYFQIMFSSNTSDYIRVPLMSFAINQGANCQLKVQYVPTSKYFASNIILGGYFYTEFFVATQNVYSLPYGDCEVQHSQLWNKTTASYIGD